jgi:hypothetical protein
MIDLLESSNSYNCKFLAIFLYWIWYGIDIGGDGNPLGINIKNLVGSLESCLM